MTIDWALQWQLFAHDFYDGYAHIPIGNKTLLLIPGAGFGDLSHPTTQIMIELMAEKVVGEKVIDIGTGSGILALAALLMGAQSAIGIDIDDEALKHARKNADLNHLSAKFRKTVPKDVGGDAVFLLNMILSEQRVVAPSRYKGKCWIVSGILKAQEQQFFDQAEEWGWNPVRSIQKSDWSGYILKTH